jgi:hypothetical protein
VSITFATYSLQEWASLLHKAAWYAWRTGNVGDAEEMSVETMMVRRNLYGQEHKETLKGMKMVGLAYKLRSRWEEAEELDVQVMEARKRVLGPEHPDTLTSMANVASTYQNQERWYVCSDIINVDEGDPCTNEVLPSGLLEDSTAQRQSR